MPRPDDGTVRSWRALRWLAGRHEVAFVPMGSRTTEEDLAAAGHHLPPGVAVAAPTQVPAGEAEPVALFVGSLDYGPNRHGLTWLLGRVWPAVVHRVPDARLRIVGRGGRRLDAVRTTPGVEVVGEGPDVRPAYAASRVACVPIHFGGGLPNKLLEAAACGRPVVTTPFVGRRLGAPAPGIRVAPGPRSFADALVALLADPGRAADEGACALSWVCANGSEDQWAEDMARLETLVRQG